MIDRAELRQAIRDMLDVLHDEYLTGHSTKGGDITYYAAAELAQAFEDEQGKAAHDAAWSAELQQVKVELPDDSFYRWLELRRMGTRTAEQEAEWQQLEVERVLDGHVPPWP